jgi:hypothetical protein
LLADRKTHVVFVQQDGVEPLELTPEQIKQGVEIEKSIVEKLRVSHGVFINNSK